MAGFVSGGFPRLKSIRDDIHFRYYAGQCSLFNVRPLLELIFSRLAAETYQVPEFLATLQSLYEYSCAPQACFEQ